MRGERNNQIMKTLGGFYMLGENLKNIRKRKGMTQDELAERLNVVRQTVSKWENNLSVPDAQILQRIAEILDVSVSELLGAKMEEGEDINELALQLSRINEQLVIKNQRGRRIWKIIGIILIIIVGVHVLLILLNVVSFSSFKEIKTETVIETELPEK